MTTLTENQRVAIIMALLGISIFLTYYFHAILMLGTVFSHFFYLPIILTALWWEKRSILVAIFLGGLVVVSSLLYRPDILTLNDYGRALMFVVIAFVVASLSEQLKGRERELKKQRDLAQRYLDVAGVLFVVINADHTIRLINRHGCELLGYQEEELVGKDWFTTVIPEASREARRQIFDAAIASGNALPRRENPVVTRNGDELILAWQDTVLTDDDGRPVGLVGSGSDITDRIRAEEALRVAHNEANLYLDIMAHDINNANAVALGYADLLVEALEGKEREMIRKLRSGISRSIEIIQDVSTIRRLHSHETATRPVDLDAVIRAEIAHHPDCRYRLRGKAGSGHGRRPPPGGLHEPHRQQHQVRGARGRGQGPCRGGRRDGRGLGRGYRAGGARCGQTHPLHPLRAGDECPERERARPLHNEDAHHTLRRDHQGGGPGAGASRMRRGVPVHPPPVRPAAGAAGISCTNDRQGDQRQTLTGSMEASMIRSKSKASSQSAF